MEYARFRMHPDQVLYVIEDLSQPPPKELALYTQKEVEYNEQYFAKNGIPWRHYFGPDGPRPPPTLFMWPAKAIGDVHAVTSSHGYW